MLALEDDYLRRINHFYQASVAVVPEERRGDSRQSAQASRREAARVEKRIPPGAFRVGLDERGEALTSVRLAEFLSERVEQGTATVAFVVGGHAGLPEGVLEGCHRTFSLSSMTLTHELARVVLLEQIYRAMTILKGIPYHK